MQTEIFNLDENKSFWCEVCNDTCPVSELAFSTEGYNICKRCEKV